ncbi:hypothetical protein PHYSODRAFT_483198 [Phytophthora sojae]|uniref:Uncharacterized protein n=1 Tax=Phytophthora sojae (strain P6497) TaxID=1094619 RepID=G4YWQ4_PHYSP|nr:hypothetical protein PHYSODRAFT_483198 [Phytophthora sojae]EGZ23774.1 hypothetical protein PHYSODRAFT_483198 [Phytophthora sojae]|eukprot:XP_009519062.1 hypothetical protein PHYSODRAFT_483198 [Phytophthora sojae]
MVLRRGPHLGERSGFAISARRLLLLMWMSIGVAPLLLQARSYVRFVTPHKISKSLLPPETDVHDKTNLLDHCPVDGLFVAGIWWNVTPLYYFQVEDGKLCHFVVPQYNIHGNYFLGNKATNASSTTPSSCANESYAFKHYFYHGSIGYFAFYEEARGTYCAIDKTAYVLVGGLGTHDCNGAQLAHDRGSTEYRESYWYGISGSVWIAYRVLMLRRSYISCKRYGKRCDRMCESLRLNDAVVYVQESIRLSAYDARNYHRFALLYLLVEGLMSDLFLLIAQEGMMGRLQYISLGYNLSGVMSMLFEMLETMRWLGEKLRCLLKRLLFNYETMLLGECVCAGAMQHYLTALNRSRGFKHSQPASKFISPYVWSLVGHGVIVLGCVLVLVSVRSLGAIFYMRWKYGCFAVLTTVCCVDTTLGVRGKLVVLGGYSYDNARLYYKLSTLKAFGMMKMMEENGQDFLVLHKLYWIAIPRRDLFVIGSVHGRQVQPCPERFCTGVVTSFTQVLGGPVGGSGTRRWLRGAFDNRVDLEPATIKVASSRAESSTTVSSLRTPSQVDVKVSRPAVLESFR